MRSFRQQDITSNSVQLLTVRKARAQIENVLIVRASEPTLLPLSVFTPVPSQLMAWYRDAVDGSLRWFSIKDYIYNEQTQAMQHANFALVLMGPPRMGKTPFAKSVAMAIAAIYQAGNADEPYAVVVNTVEALPRGDGRLRRGTPIVFDDMRPSGTRGNRPPHTLDDMKVLGDIGTGGDMAARYSDIHFQPMMPRIFTSNDSTPRAFFNTFPPNLQAMSPAEVVALDNNTKALLKRYAFCEVGASLIPATVQDAFRQSQVAAVSAVARQLYVGLSAIP
jgi:hypothetical protein